MKLLATISHHGLGHLAQAAPVLNSLRAQQPDLELTIWSGLSFEALQARVEGSFEHRHAAADIGLIMHDAMRVDLPASHLAFKAFHADWPQRIALEANWMRARAFDLVFSDVAYLPLAAAAHAEIDGIALCSLNWQDIAQAYLAQLPGMNLILQQIGDAYAAASVFLQPTPSMPMPQLPYRLTIPPISGQGSNRRSELIEKLALPTNCKLALIGFGGVAYAGKGRLPSIKDVVWLAPEDWQSRSLSDYGIVGGKSTAPVPFLPVSCTMEQPCCGESGKKLPRRGRFSLSTTKVRQAPSKCEARADMFSFKQAGLSFLDLLASCDVLITKVGYGSFVEATAHAVPVLYIDRPDWPETPYLTTWLCENGNAAVIEECDLFSPRLESQLREIWEQPSKPAIHADGAEQAARRLLAHQKPVQATGLK